MKLMMLAMAVVNDADEDARANESTHRQTHRNVGCGEGKRDAEIIKFHEKVMDPSCHTKNTNPRAKA